MTSRQRLILVLVALTGCVGCDQGTKILAERALAGAAPVSLLGGMVRLTYTENAGAFLSLGAGLPESLRFSVFVVLVAFGLAALLFVTLADGRLTTTQVAALSLLTGGGLSNLADRVANHGAVVDFMNLGIGRLRTGIFNVADVAIMGGAVLLALSSLRRAA